MGHQRISSDQSDVAQRLFVIWTDDVALELDNFFQQDLGAHVTAECIMATEDSGHCEALRAEPLSLVDRAGRRKCQQLILIKPELAWFVVRSNDVYQILGPQFAG